MEIEKAGGGFVNPHDLLLLTDWNRVEHCCEDVAPLTPEFLLQLLDEDPVVQGHALRDLIEALTPLDTVFSAAPPAALFVAAILGDPRTLAEVTDRVAAEEFHLGPKEPFPLRVGLLDWLGYTAEQANRQPTPPNGDEEDLDALLATGPTVLEAIRPFLADAAQAVREAALAAALPLLVRPELAHHAPALGIDEETLAEAREAPFRQRTAQAPRS
ncbi:hypothetical protein ACFVGY_08050 [Streptomyces sp. NPDC127106]|uniref:hypothetical protein n=1 Tax=Streptomyces sp. NPDC127106 TaxID=3345360 RepID=UPI003628FECA